MKPRLRPVRKTKEPKQHVCKNMAYNLSVLSGCSTCVEISSWCFIIEKRSVEEVDFCIYSSEIGHYVAKTWDDLFSAYLKFKKGFENARKI